MFQRNEDFNIIKATDGYKITHWKQYPEGTQRVYSYFESRGGRHPSTIFFGLQYFLRRYLEGQVVTAAKIDEAEAHFKPYIGDQFNRAGWEHILNKHGGRLPVRICAVPEGSDNPTGTPLITVENTDEDVPWLTNYLETLLSKVWAPTTVATYSNYFRRMLLKHLRSTGSAAGIDFMLHDFGDRGVACPEAAGLLGAAHLVNFLGTDTLAAMDLLREHYHAEGSPGFSIPASEHSTITTWENEVDAFRNMLKQYPTGPVACVSDSWNIFNACEKLWGKELKEEVLARDGVLVVRPDSGHPPTIVKEVLDSLGRNFEVRKNTTGFKMLDDHVRVIQGDGIDLKMADKVLSNARLWGWAAENVVFGSGGGLLQRHDRDSQRFAFKCSAIKINDEWRDIWKDPITDPGKVSKRGKFTGAGLAEVFYNGETWTQKLNTIRERAHIASDAL